MERTELPEAHGVIGDHQLGRGRASCSRIASSSSLAARASSGVGAGGPSGRCLPPRPGSPHHQGGRHRDRMALTRVDRGLRRLPHQPGSSGSDVPRPVSKACSLRYSMK